MIMPQRKFTTILRNSFVTNSMHNMLTYDIQLIYHLHIQVFCVRHNDTYPLLKSPHVSGTTSEQFQVTDDVLVHSRWYCQLLAKKESAI